MLQHYRTMICHINPQKNSFIQNVRRINITKKKAEQKKKEVHDIHTKQ